MFSTAFGNLVNVSDESFGVGYTRMKDLYAPLQEGEEWGDELEPQNLDIQVNTFLKTFKTAELYQQPGEASKRLTCILKGAYISRQIQTIGSLTQHPC